MHRVTSRSATRSSRRDRAFVHCSDEALVVRTARGDELAFAELYDRTGAHAYGLAVRILRNPSLAEEATQEAFVAVWRNAARFDARRGGARAWILLQTRARAIDRVRHEERRGGQMLEADDETLESVGTGVAEEAWARLEREHLETALTEIPDRERELIELAYFEGYTQSELATRLGLPLGTVKRRTFDALARLRVILEGDR
jgi:RNA polymerase sigma-70 factor (ECF subfamily)